MKIQINAPEISLKLKSKDIKNLPRIQKKVYDFLLWNGKSTIADITIGTKTSDPRKHIQTLRLKGVNIKDEWVVSYYGNRCKKYWIDEN